MKNITDTVLVWYIKNILMPNLIIIDKPGFFIAKFSSKNKVAYRRQLFMSEDILSGMEKKLINKYDRKAKQVLYSAGKKFGYHYANLSNFPKKSEANEKEIKEFINKFLLFLQAMWADKVEITNLDIKNDIFEVELDNYVVFRKDGFGYSNLDGAASGFWAFISENKNVDGLRLEKDKNKLMLTMAPHARKHNIEYFNEPDLKQIAEKNYEIINALRPTNFAKVSMKELIDSRIFNYDKRTVEYNGLRFFPCEATLLFTLETELKKLKEGNKALYEAAFEVGFKIASKPDNLNEQFISDFLGAQGWGDIQLKNTESATILHYPWSGLNTTASYDMIKGIVSGMVSKLNGREIHFKKHSAKLQLDTFKLLISK